MLLTSSQVSVAVSFGVVVFCTFALFMSGYVLQQRTLRQLRQSIREPPPEPPKIFLPDRFKKMTTELPDGTIVVINDDGDDKDSPDDSGSAQRLLGPSDDVPSRSQVDHAADGSGSDSHDSPVVEVKLSRQGAEDERTPQQPLHSPAQITTNDEAQNDVKNADDAEALRVSAASDPERQKPISKAERRRRIKAELFRLAHDDKPVYYQRRLY